MILGVGTDISDFTRMREALERSGPALADRLFTPEEQARCRRRRDPIPCFASRFAAKESLSKALGVGLGPIGITSAEVVNDARGAPSFRFHGRLKAWMESVPGLRVHLSLSDGEQHAVAFVVLESDKVAALPPFPGGSDS